MRIAAVETRAIRATTEKRFFFIDMGLSRLPQDVPSNDMQGVGMLPWVCLQSGRWKAFQTGGMTHLLSRGFGKLARVWMLTKRKNSEKLLSFLPLCLPRKFPLTKVDGTMKIGLPHHSWRIALRWNDVSFQAQRILRSIYRQASLIHGLNLQLFNEYEAGAANGPLAQWQPHAILVRLSEAKVLADLRRRWPEFRSSRPA